MKEGSVNNVIKAMNAKEIFLALRVVGTHCLKDSYLESTNTYYMMSVRWYVLCSVNIQDGPASLEYSLCNSR